MDPLARVGVLVQMGAIEEPEPVLVGGKVRGHPVQDDPDPVLVQVVDQIHEVLWRSVPAGRSEVSGPRRHASTSRGAPRTWNWAGAARSAGADPPSTRRPPNRSRGPTPRWPSW